MKNNLTRRDLGKGLIGGLGVLVFEGCKTTSGFGSGKTGYPTNQVHDFKIKKIDQDNSPYKLHEVVIFGKEYLMQHVNPKKDDTLNIGFFKRRDAVSRLDLKSREVRLRPENNIVYVPTKVKVQDGDDKGKYIDEVVLAPNTVNIAEKDELKLEREIQASALYDMRLNEDDATFNLKTVDLPKLGEYFIVRVAQKDKHKGQLPFYLIPVHDAQIDVYNSDGRLAIHNQDSVYRPVKFNLKYEGDRDKKGGAIATEQKHTE